MQINDLLSLFDLTQNEQEVYLILNKTLWLTVLQLSKKTDLKRSTLYRILDSLYKKGIIEMKVDDKTTYYTVGDISSFKSYVMEQEKKASDMKQGLQLLNSQLSMLKNPTLLETSVKFYRGKRSLQNMEWKMCNQKNIETFIFGSDQWNYFSGEDFAEEMREKRVKNNSIVKEILNIKNDAPIPKNGQVSWTSIPNYIEKYYQHRSISTKILHIQTEIIINPDSIFIQSYENDEIVGIELVSPSFAKSLRQLFMMVWNKAEVLDDFGGEDF